MTHAKPLFLVLALGLVLVATAACTKSSRPKHNECDWPNDCGGSVLPMLNDIGGWVVADLKKDRTKTNIYQRIMRGVQRTKDPELSNASNKHVCLLTNPAPCQELDQIHAAAEAAKNASDAEARDKWEAVAAMMDHFPSGS
jgi:hypothetical protein